TDAGAASTEAPRPVERGDNGRLILIPSIEVSAPLREMELVDVDGPIATPDGPDLVGWYPDMEQEPSTPHGLLLGHVNWRDGSTGVFARLGELGAGDLVELHDGPETS